VGVRKDIDPLSCPVALGGARKIQVTDEHQLIETFREGIIRSKSRVHLHKGTIALQRIEKG
jgi:hypothetical protein